MSIDVFSQIAWLPVIVGAIIYYVLGAIWYSPVLFLKPWLRSQGQDAPVTDAMAIVVPAVSILVMSVATGALAVATASTTLSAGIVLGLTVGIGYACAIAFLDAGTDRTKPAPWTWFAIGAAYHVIGLAIVGALVGAWR